MTKQKLVNQLSEAIASLQEALNTELSKEVLATSYQDMVDNTPADISARYWLMQVLAPLSRKELQSVVDGFLVQMLNEEQARKLVKFLLIRFPSYYQQEPGLVMPPAQPAQVALEPKAPEIDQKPQE